ncbi:MAG: hypothetical protein ACRDKW_01225 [Actinomycetota bacterium]
MSIALGSTATEHVTSLDQPLIHKPALPSGVWWAWECPVCGRSYEAGRTTCPEDGVLLHGVQCSLPFVWIG